MTETRLVVRSWVSVIVLAIDYERDYGKNCLAQPAFFPYMFISSRERKKRCPE
jgi:hypothetical protein